MKQTNVRIPAEVHAAIKSHAADSYRTMASLMQEILTDYAKALRKKKESQS